MWAAALWGLTAGVLYIQSEAQVEHQASALCVLPLNGRETPRFPVTQCLAHTNAPLTPVQGWLGSHTFPWGFPDDSQP